MLELKVSCKNILTDLHTKTIKNEANLCGWLVLAPWFSLFCTISTPSFSTDFLLIVVVQRSDNDANICQNWSFHSNFWFRSTQMRLSGIESLSLITIFPSKHWTKSPPKYESGRAWAAFSRLFFMVLNIFTLVFEMFILRSSLDLIIILTIPWQGIESRASCVNHLVDVATLRHSNLWLPGRWSAMLLQPHIRTAADGSLGVVDEVRISLP